MAFQVNISSLCSLQRNRCFSDALETGFNVCHFQNFRRIMSFWSDTCIDRFRTFYVIKFKKIKIGVRPTSFIFFYVSDRYFIFLALKECPAPYLVAINILLTEASLFTPLVRNAPNVGTHYQVNTKFLCFIVISSVGYI